MADKIGKSISAESVTFTYVAYGMWSASTSGTKRILATCNANDFIVGDGSGYCKLFDLSSGTITARSTSSSPYTATCVVCSQ